MWKIKSLPLAANSPPVKNPDTTGFIKSSLLRKWIRVHSHVLNNPPQSAKDPPNIGARFFINITLSLLMEHLTNCVLFIMNYLIL